MGPKLVKTEGGTTTRYAFAHPNAASYIAWLFQGVIWQFGGRYSDDKFKMLMDSPEGIEAGNYVRSQVFTLKYTNVTAKDVNADFLAGTTYSMLSSTGGLAGVLRARAAGPPGRVGRAGVAARGGRDRLGALAGDEPEVGEPEPREHVADHGAQLGLALGRRGPRPERVADRRPVHAAEGGIEVRLVDDPPGRVESGERERRPVRGRRAAPGGRGWARRPDEPARRAHGHVRDALLRQTLDQRGVI